MARDRHGKKPNEYERFEACETSCVRQNENGKWAHMFQGNDGQWRYDNTTNLTQGMLESEAFKDLTPRQRMLYIYAKSQFFNATNRPADDFPEVEKFQAHKGQMYFYLNHALLSDVFGLYPKSNTRDLYKDAAALEAHGFIKCVTPKRPSGKRNHAIENGKYSCLIYTYSDAWHHWKRAE